MGRNRCTKCLGGPRCEECKRKMRLWVKAIRERRVASGLCQECGKPRGDWLSKCLCKKCSKRSRERMRHKKGCKRVFLTLEKGRGTKSVAELRRGYRKKKREAGICAGCPNKVEPGKKSCSVCLGKQRDRRLVRKQKGLCGSCQNPREPGSFSCRVCLEKKAAYATRRYHEKSRG